MELHNGLTFFSLTLCHKHFAWTSDITDITMIIQEWFRGGLSALNLLIIYISTVFFPTTISADDVVLQLRSATCDIDSQLRSYAR